MPSYARELPPRTAAVLTAEAARHRPAQRTAQSAEQERRERAKLTNKVLIRGRWNGRAMVWDVVKLLGGRAELYASGCLCREEAVELAVACLSGRICVSLAGTRTLLLGGARRVAVPERSVQSFGAVELAPAGPGAFEVRKRT